ncbi:MAG: NHLP bacteriocin system secretion protein [Deltaproteobacteria bacterium]|nr:NHLP bacteriocin system secretion protein [Deltaproteobacteria bacterium]
MREQLFRKVALERQSSPERLDVLMQVTSRKGWLSLLAVGGLLLCAVLWSVLGYIPVKSDGQGMLMSAGGVYEIVSNSAGALKGIYFEPGEIIQKGRTVARVDQPELLARIREASASLNGMRADLEHLDSASAQERRALEDSIRQAERSLQTLQNEYAVSSKVTSPFTGRILELTVRTGAIVAKGTPLMRIELEGSEFGSLQAVLYFPAAAGEAIRQGMPAEISPFGVERSEYGFLKGLVTHVSGYPSSTAGMMQTLQNETLVQGISRQGPVIEVIVDLIPDPAAPTGFKWSSSRGPATKLQTGMICLASVTISQQRVINLLFPSINKRMSGIE